MISSFALSSIQTWRGSGGEQLGVCFSLCVVRARCGGCPEGSRILAGRVESRGCVYRHPVTPDHGVARIAQWLAAIREASREAVHAENGSRLDWGTSDPRRASSDETRADPCAGWAPAGYRHSFPLFPLISLFAPKRYAWEDFGMPCV